LKEGTIDKLVRHDIYAGNTLLGDALFLTLNLPPEWQLTGGVGRPDIVASHERRGKTWVANGSGWYVVFDQQRRWALEVAIHIRQPRKNKSPLPGEALYVNGHTAGITRKIERRGPPWRRHDVSFITVGFECPYSERHLELEFSGWCPAEGFQEIIQALSHLRCH
jgi:hypothetical protein